MKAALLSILAFGLATAALADQCALLEVAVARRATVLIHAGDTVLKFCEPCDDDAPMPIQVETVTTRPWDNDPKLAEIVVNGEGIDAAYIFVRSPEAPKSWRNLATLIDCPASDVSELLDFSLPKDRPPIATARPPEALLNLDITDRNFDGSSFGRDWQARQPVELHADPERRSGQTLRIPAGTAAKMLEIRTKIEPGQVKVLFAKERFRAGDVFWRLDQLGEGYERIYFDGRVEEVFFEDLDTLGKPCPKPGKTCWAEIQNPAKETWWARLELADGRQGWVENPAETFEGVWQGH